MKRILLYLIFLPVILFVDYVLVAITGCIASTLNADEGFYCGPYCFYGLAILIISVVVSLYFFRKLSGEYKQPARNFHI